VGLEHLGGPPRCADAPGEDAAFDLRPDLFEPWRRTSACCFSTRLWERLSCLRPVVVHGKLALHYWAAWGPIVPGSKKQSTFSESNVVQKSFWISTFRAATLVHRAFLLVPPKYMLARVLARVLATLLHDLVAANAAAHHHSIHTFDADPLNTRHRPTGHTRQRHTTLSPRGTDTVCDHTKHNPSPTWDAMSQYHLLTYPRVRPEAVLSPPQEIQR
jgi:hypothetical protein